MKEAGATHQQSLLEDAKKDLDEGRLPLWMVADQRVFDLEVEKLWGNTWQFLAHESEIPKPGDYVVRSIGPYDSVIIIRTEEGRVNAFQNVCAHRGMRLCRAEIGNTSHFRCPYHGWTYNSDGRLIGVPYRQIAYGDYPVTEKYGLVSVKTEEFNGLIFGNLDEKAPSLEAFLGDFRWYLEMLTDRTEKGLEFYPPQRYVVPTNWKLPAENIAGDQYHVQSVHKSLVDIGMIYEGKAVTFEGSCLSINGHTFNMVRGEIAKAQRPMFYPLYWPEYPKLLEKRMKEGHLKVLNDAYLIFGNMFPNVGYMNHAALGEAPFIDFRMWRPISPDKTEIIHWFAVEREAPESFKRASFKSSIQSHNVAGLVEQDDVEVWKGITNNSKSIGAKKVRLNYDIGIKRRKHFEDWPGPGYPVVEGPNELNSLQFWRELVRRLQT